MKFLTEIDLNKNQLKNAVVHGSASAPGTPGEGQIYFNTSDKTFYCWNGTLWAGSGGAPDLSTAVMKALYTPQSILFAAATTGVPNALTIPVNSIVGRVAGDVTTLLIDNDLTSVSASDDTVPSAKATKTYADTKQSALTFGILTTNAVQVNGTATSGLYAKWTSTGITSVPHATVLSDIGAMPASYLSTNTALGTSDVLVPTQNAVKVYADTLIAAANALVYKGVLDCSANPNYPAASAGDMYVVSVAGLIGGAGGLAVDAGDMLMCKTDSTASGNQATVGAQWNSIERNLSGVVLGPTSVGATDYIAVYNGTTGKLLKDGGVTIASLQNQNANHTGDVTGSSALTIASHAVTFAKFQQLAANTFVGNNTGALADAKALTVAEMQTALSITPNATTNTGTVVKYSATIGDGATTSIPVTHSLNTRDLTYKIYETATPWAEVAVDCVLNTVNQLTLNFSVAPTAGQYRVVVMA
jgi:hypothetical protein